MRLLLLLRDSAPNGITTYNRILARHLVTLGHEVHVWRADKAFAAATGAQVHGWLPQAHPLFAPLAQPWLTRGIRPDLLFVNGYTQARFAHRLRAASGIPWVACMHNGHGPARMAEWLALFGNAAGVVTMCGTLQDSYTRLIAGGAAAQQPPVLLSRLPVELPALRVRVGTAPLTLGYCSRLSGQKGPRCETWLRAIARLPDRERYRVLVIGGGRHLKALQATAAELGLDAEFSGMVADPAPLLERIDVITGAGYALLEGLLRGAAAVGLGFGGCIGAVSAGTLDKAYALNFGDHCPRPFPADADTIASALVAAIASLGSADLAQVHARSRAISAPGPIVGELLEFLAQAAREG